MGNVPSDPKGVPTMIFKECSLRSYRASLRTFLSLMDFGRSAQLGQQR